MRRSVALLPASLFGSLLVLAAGCSQGDAGRADTATATAESAARQGNAQAATPQGASPQAGAPAAGAADNAPALWLVSPRGIGPIAAGMRFSAAAPLLGVPASAGTGSPACAYVRPAHGPAGVSVMVRGGEVARVQVDSGDVATTEGARIGDSEARIDSLYAGRVTVGPHKYTSGHVLTVKPADGESPYRLVFETDGKRVTRYRAGRLPEVEWVEGCA